MLDLGLTCKDDLSLCPIFRQLSPRQRQIVLDHVRYETLQTGETLIREGDVQRGLHVLIDGRCEVVKETSSDGEQQLAVLDSGAIIGEVSFFSEAPHSASVRALEPCEAMRFSVADFADLKERHPEIAMQLVLNMGRLLAERFRRMDQYTYDLFVRRRNFDGDAHREVHQGLYRDQVARTDQLSRRTSG